MKLREYFDQLAPVWDSEVTPERLERLNTIVEKLGIKPGYYVLDIGSGTGILLPFLIAALGNEGKIVALDFSAEMLSQAKGKNLSPIVNFTQADVLAIPLADKCMDLAICNGAFPHFRDKRNALKEIARVLKNNGRLVICHTASREMINRLHQSIGGAIANDLLPTEFEMRKMVSQSGFTVSHFEDGPERYLVIADKNAR